MKLIFWYLVLVLGILLIFLAKYAAVIHWSKYE